MVFLLFFVITGLSFLNWGKHWSPSNLVKLLIIVVLNQMKSKTKLNVDFWERETGAPREKSQGRVNKINKFNPHIASFPEVRLVES